MFEKEENFNKWSKRNKWLLAFVAILILVAIASVVTLAVLGLIVSPWLVIPCILFFIAMGILIKTLYPKNPLDANQANDSKNIMTEDIQTTKAASTPKNTVKLKTTDTTLPTSYSPSPLISVPSPPKPSNLSPLNLYEVVPDPNNPKLNVKLVVWSNVKALGKTFSEIKDFERTLISIKQTINPDIILLFDTPGPLNVSKSRTLTAFRFEEGFVTTRYSNNCQVFTKYWLISSYSDGRGSEIIEGAYEQSDTAEPLSIRFICPKIAPHTGKSVEETRTILSDKLFNQAPLTNWASPRLNRPAYREGDHVIIIIPEETDSPKNCDVLYKSFKKPGSDLQKILKQELIMTETGMEVKNTSEHNNTLSSRT